MSFLDTKKKTKKKNLRRAFGLLICQFLHKLCQFHVDYLCVCVFEAVSCFYHHTCRIPLWLSVKRVCVCVFGDVPFGGTDSAAFPPPPV